MLIKEIGEKTAKLADLSLTRMERAKIKIEIESKEKDLLEFNAHVKVTDKVIEHYRNFDEAIFYLSENGTENMESIRRMNTYQFYRHKQLVRKKIDSINSEMSKYRKDG